MAQAGTEAVSCLDHLQTIYKTMGFAGILTGEESASNAGDPS